MSVLICTRDRPDMLERCLRSLRDNTVRPREVLVVDQSADTTTRTLLSDIGDLPLQHVRDDGRGLSHAQNLGLACASADIVLITDDDVVLPEDWVEVGWRLFASDPGLGLAGGRVEALGPDEPGRYPVSTRPSTTSRELDGHSLPWDVGSGNNFGVRRSRVGCVGGNDERLGPGAVFMGGADMDLFRRLLRSGVRGLYAPEWLVLHERASQQERLDRRVPYGYGMGAAISLWFRQGDDQAVRLGKSWLRLRLHRLRDGVRQRDALRVREEALVLAGTVRGLVRGALAESPLPEQSHTVVLHPPAGEPR